MRPTIEQIKEAIKQEALRHGLIQESCRVDIPPTIEVPGRHRSFDHEISCKCGYKYEIYTQHSGQTEAGCREFHQALGPELSEHAVESAAQMIHELHATTQ